MRKAEDVRQDFTPAGLKVEASVNLFEGRPNEKGRKLPSVGFLIGRPIDKGRTRPSRLHHPSHA